MRDVFYLAWRYLLFHRFKTALLILAIALIVTLPAGLQTLVRKGERQLRARASSTPLLLGRKGSPLELTLNALYFRTAVPAPVSYAEVDRLAATGLADPIPLYVRFRAQSDKIVGTTLDYFSFRGLRLAAGGQMARLGDCVLGSAVARRRGLKPGDSVISSPESVFDIAGVFPLKMHVTGILDFADSPDDHAIFVEIKTAWVIEGLGHGHGDLKKPELASGVLKKEAGNIVANASILQYNEITDDNMESFHFHGALDAFPVSGILAVPPDRKNATLLMGRYQDAEQRLQILQPIQVMDELLVTVFTVQRFVIAALVLVALATLALAALVLLLSGRLRRREIETLHRIGGEKTRVGAILAAEAVLVTVAGLALAVLLTWITGLAGDELIRLFLIRA